MTLYVSNTCFVNSRTMDSTSLASLASIASMPVPDTLIRASVQGIVYLIESATGKVFTYNLEKPTYIGMLEKIPEEDKHMISKTNGCLANARIKYREDVREVMRALRSH